MDKPEFFYCYSKKLFKFLKFEKGHNYVCTALNENTLNKFWLFKTTEELNNALAEYRNMIKS